MTIGEKVSYLKGLLEGLAVEENSKEGKLFKAVVDVLDDMALSIADLEDGMAEVTDMIDTLDEDLGEVEEELFGDDEDADDDYYEVECPECGEVICLDEDLAALREVECPVCGETIEFELDDEDCCPDGCCCGDDSDVN